MSDYSGKDNYGRLRSDYLVKIAAMPDGELESECYSMIYQSARCSNNPRADWHWMVDACYDESDKRTNGAPIYSKAHKRCCADHS